MKGFLNPLYPAASRISRLNQPLQMLFPHGFTLSLFQTDHAVTASLILLSLSIRT